MKLRARGIAKQPSARLLLTWRVFLDPIDQGHEQEVHILYLTFLCTIRRQEVRLGLIPPVPSNMEARDPAFRERLLSANLVWCGAGCGV